MAESNPFIDPAPPCPICGNKNTAHLLYGLPAMTPEFEKALDEGRVSLAGCLVGENDPRYGCRSCGNKW